MRFCSLRCNGASKKGAKNPNWKGGKAKRSAANYAALKKVRDVGYCERCGSVESLQGHHVKLFSTHPELGADRLNIIVLCALCHGKEHPERQNALLALANVARRRKSKDLTVS